VEEMERKYQTGKERGGGTGKTLGKPKPGIPKETCEGPKGGGSSPRELCEACSTINRRENFDRRKETALTEESGDRGVKLWRAGKPARARGLQKGKQGKNRARAQKGCREKKETNQHKPCPGSGHHQT